LVRANDVVVRKASDEIAVDAAISATPAHPYVSRGALKLKAALDHFGFDPSGLTCLDVGASTGGFTEILLERGVRRVYAVDVGRAQLHDRLRSNAKVTSLEDTDIRKLAAAGLDEPAQFICIDVSFISLKHVLPAAVSLAVPDAVLVALIKPQFEAGPEHNKKGSSRPGRSITRRASCATLPCTRRCALTSKRSLRRSAGAYSE
jgi:23S rRNA (cytidine1920-2'-O)/16S rRNA (cytidine1409-2'-O)-methyltransferase